MGSEANSTLRARLRRITESERERRCGVSVCFEQGPGLVFAGKPGGWEGKWTGVLTCGHIWTCPCCSTRIRNERCKRVLRCLKNAGGRWQMVTLTARHRPGMPLREFLRALMVAWRKVRQGGAIQRIWTARVSASVRAAEVTHGKNGWHPHLHVVLRTTEWTEDQRERLLIAWQLQVERALGAECVPDDEHAIDWADPVELCKGEDVADTQQRVFRYLFKLGLEVTGAGKRGRRGSRSAWQIAEDATRGDAASVALWLEYCRATKGRRMIELDDRAQRYAKMPDPERDDVLHDSTIERVTVPVDALELRALREYERRFDPAILAHVIADARTAERPETVVKAWLDLVCRRLAYTGSNGPEASRASRDGPACTGPPRRAA